MGAFFVWLFERGKGKQSKKVARIPKNSEENLGLAEGKVI